MISCTIHFILGFFFFGGGGAQNLSLPPGASYPRYATADELPGGLADVWSGGSTDE